MKNVYEDIRGMIGNTPILKLNHMGIRPGVNIYAKLELMNPAGSVKDRIGVYMIDDAKRRGVLKEGGTIIDATAGNNFNSVFKIDVDKRLLPLVQEFKPATWRADIKK